MVWPIIVGLSQTVLWNCRSVLPVLIMERLCSPRIDRWVDSSKNGIDLVVVQRGVWSSRGVRSVGHRREVSVPLRALALDVVV